MSHSVEVPSAGQVGQDKGYVLTIEDMAVPAQVNILEAKNQLSRLVKEAAAGREIVIASRGTPMARLVPLRAPRRLRRWGTLKASQARIDAAFTPEVDEQVARLFGARRK